jgi:hypothetical protein
VREFDSELAKYGLDASSSPRPSNQGGGCAILALAVATIPVIIAALGVVRLVG